LDECLVSACAQRLERVDGCKIEKLTGNAEETATATISKLQRSGLHFAFIDPFNADLPFSVLATLGELSHMDLLIHFSIMDLSRNLNSMKQDGRLDELAPGWTSAINIKMGIDEQRMGIFKHWRGLLEKRLKYSVSDKIIKVRGPNRAEIYWLVFASRHDLGGKLWKEIADLNPQPQRELF
jgi:three-Cys-motif partner protein